MNLYLIGGLGADYRVFEYTEFNCNTKVLEWIEPAKKDNIQTYARKLLEQIDQSKPFSILGVSFGGVIAVELSKICKAEKVFIISSVVHDNQLPQAYLKLGSSLLKRLPDFLCKPPVSILALLFGTNKTQLLAAIIHDTKPQFIRWAISELAAWKNELSSDCIIRIHGTKDRLIPLKGRAIEIEQGGHFMIVDQAERISQIVNKALNI